MFNLDNIIVLVSGSCKQGAWISAFFVSFLFFFCIQSVSYMVVLVLRAVKVEGIKDFGMFFIPSV